MFEKKSGENRKNRKKKVEKKKIFQICGKTIDFFLTFFSDFFSQIFCSEKNIFFEKINLEK